VFGRLAPGATLAQARTSLNGVYHAIINDVEAPLQKGMSDPTMVRFRAKQIGVNDGRRGQSSVSKEAGTPLAMLFAITGIVLLIACANIANLLLARAAGRQMEMAVRLSLGATRRQLLTQLLTESVLLALMGGAAGLLVARWTLGAIFALLPPDAAASLHFDLHTSALWFSGILAIATGFLFGLFPAMHSTRPDLIATLRAGTGKISSARAATRFRTSLVTAQIALSMALLMSAGLFIKSLRNVTNVDLGINIDHVVTFAISPELNGYENARSRVLFDRLSDELQALPGVTNAASAMVPLLAGSNWGSDVSVEGFKKGPDTDANSRYNEVAPGFFRAMGIPVLRGREFTASDGVGSPRVAVVNEAFAQKFGLGTDAVGKRMGTGGLNDTMNIEIVGLIRDAKYSDVKQPTPPQFFMPTVRDTSLGSLTFYVRTAGDYIQVLRTIPALMKKLDPNLPVENLKTMPQQVRESVFLDRMIGTLSAAFAALATLLAAVGLYGVLAYSVAQRTREIGVRMALGADGRRVRKMVLVQVGLMTLIGGLIGIGGALALGRAAKSLLFELQGTDPVVMGLAAAVLTAVALGAGYLPALKASRVDPMQALRYE
jgi:putative ABC transport system permease protein